MTSSAPPRSALAREPQWTTAKTTTSAGELPSLSEFVAEDEMTDVGRRRGRLHETPPSRDIRQAAGCPDAESDHALLCNGSDGRSPSTASRKVNLDNEGAGRCETSNEAGGGDAGDDSPQDNNEQRGPMGGPAGDMNSSIRSSVITTTSIGGSSSSSSSTIGSSGSKQGSESDTSLMTLLRRLVHWGPLMAMGIIKFVFFTCIYLTSMWFPPYETIGGTLNHLVYMAAVGLILYNFLCSVGAGGGFVPKGWQPTDKEAEAFLQYCGLCKGFKPPRAHHCRRCGHCVMKMDHHCPWINACVGHRNHRNFVSFLLFCVTGATQSIVLLCLGLHKAYNVKWYEEMEGRLEFELHMRGLQYPPPGHRPPPFVYLSFLEMLAVVLSVGLSFGVIIALGSLLYFQLRVVLRNETAIESWINQKAQMRFEDMGRAASEWKYPYDLGWKNNARLVLGWNVVDGNGIDWPIREGCNPYTLTLEQKLQKSEKRQRQRIYVVTRPYYGGYFPWCGHGFCACLRTPLNDEPRLRLAPSDRVLVTRWRKYWLYGELASSASDDGWRLTDPLDPPKGWFPRGCTVPCVGPRHVKEE